MNTTCAVEKIKNALALADKMSGKNLSLSALQALLIAAQKNEIVIRSTNLNVGIEIKIPAEVSQEGSVLVKGDVITNVCNNLDNNDTLSFTLSGENLVVKTKKVTSTIKCLPFEDFPTLPLVDGEKFTIKSETFSEGVRSVYFCAATTEIKPEIASIFIYAEQETLHFVATDSFRLAEKKITIDNFPDITRILIPYKNIADVLRVLDSLTGTITVVFNKNQLSISGGGVYFTTRLIDGAFPDYRLILPKEELTKVIVMKQELITTLRLSTIFSDKFFQVLFSVNTKDKKIAIQSKNTDVGSSDVEVDAVIEGDPIEVTFNLKYFLDVFQALHGDSISLSFTKQNKPILVKSVHDTSFLYLLVPTNR